MKRMVVMTRQGNVSFYGVYRRDLEKPNWHYYETESGDILHFRKKHIVAVLENGAGWLTGATYSVPSSS